MALVHKVRGRQSADLFAGEPANDLIEQFQGAFEAWRDSARSSHRMRRSSSEAVYEDMWGAMVQWCVTQRPAIDLTTLNSEDLRRFLDSRRGTAAESELSPRYVRRLLGLIDRVLTHHARSSDVPRNLAAAELIEQDPRIKYADSDPALPDFLAAEDARRLVVYLSSLRPRGGSRAAVGRWQDVRNAAAVGLQLGAGLTPGEVRALTLQAPVIAGGRHKGLPWKIQVPADGNRPSRETPMAPWAGALLRHWLEVREVVGFAVDVDESQAAGTQTREWLFPSTRRGRMWSKISQYDAVQQVLAAAGIYPLEGGSFRLRHTFALRQLRRGSKPEEVARWMGIADPAEMQRYERVLTKPADVV